jgi:PAS domain S-box-containing protein
VSNNDQRVAGAGDSIGIAGTGLAQSLNSDRILLSLVESAPDGMMLIDASGCIAFVNHQIEVLFGYHRDGLVGLAVEDLLPERFRSAHVEHRSGYRKTGKVRFMGAGLDLQARRVDGTEFPVEISLSPVTAGGEQCVIASVRDITDRIALEARAALVQSTLDAAHDGVFMFDPGTLKFTYVNQGAIQQTGYSRNELLAMTPLDIKPRFSTQEFLDFLHPLLSDETTSLEFRTIHRTKLGVDVPVEIILEFPPSTHLAAPRLLVAVARDITDRSAFERQLLDSEAAFRSAFDDAPVGMLTARLERSGERVIERSNRAFGELVDYEPDDLTGMSLSLLAHPDDEVSDSAAAIEMIHGTRTNYVIEKRYRRRDGTFRWVQVQSQVVEHDLGVRVLAHVLDINDRHALEAERDGQQRVLGALAELRAHLLDDESLERTLVASCGLLGTIVTADRIFLDSCNATGEPLNARNSGGDRENTDEASHHELRRHMSVGDVDQTIVLQRKVGRQPFDETDIRGVESFLRQGETAIQLAVARRDRQRLTLFEDRERIARDLHDVVIQRIFAAGLGLESLRSQVSPTSAAEKIQATVDQLDTAMRELRSTIFGLTTFEARIPIDKQIYDLVAAHHGTLGFEPTIALAEHIASVPPVVIEQLIPTLNEVLSNIARHANATTTQVVIDLTGDDLLLTVTDNGRGLDDAAIRGNGISNLERRAHRLGGSGGISNLEGGGTLVTWRVPV